MSRVSLRYWACGMAWCAVAVPAAWAAGSDDAIPAGWLQTITENIQSSEYHFSPTEDGAWSAPNRAHDLRVRLGEDGPELCSRTRGCTTEGGGWLLTLQVVRFGRGRALVPVAPALLTAEENRVEFLRKDMTEWYVNDENGLEQGFTIKAPPGTDRRSPLVIEMEPGGGLKAYPSGDQQAVVFRAGPGEDVLRYSKLIVHDATGDDLEAAFDFEDGRLRILVHDEHAIYPLEIDPLMTSPDWTMENDLEGSWLGISVATAGDVNGDGFSDVIVGANGYDYLGYNEGRAYVYHGSASGLSTTAAWESSGSPPWEGGSFGYSVSTAGDVNGDGYDDVIVGDPAVGPFSNGKVFVYYGSEAGLADSWMAESSQHAELGASVSYAGDVNGDGYDDVIAGAPTLLIGNPAGSGRALVWYGSETGLEPGSIWDADWIADSAQADSEFGRYVGTAGDVNGDGYDDVIVGAEEFDDPETDEGRVFVWYGSASGLGANGTPANADWTAESNQAGAAFGTSAGTAGDLNGDGYADICIGAPLYDDPEDTEGAVFVFYGSSTGLGAAGSPGNADWIAQSDQALAWLGREAATAGDVNGDGFGDLILGAHHLHGDTVDEGAALAWYGSASGLGPNGTPANADWSVESDQGGAGQGPWFGFSVATAGDVNGDGFSEVIVGSPYHDNGELNEGRAYVYHGSPAGLSTSPTTREANQAEADFGFSVASAGDVDGDGYSDVLVGARQYDNGENNEGMAFLYLGAPDGPSTDADWTAEGNQAGAYLGRAVAGAGDVNGDGYSDVIIGAPGYSNPEEEEGAAFVWLGSGTGMGKDGVPANAAWSVESNQGSLLLGPSLGWDVASAGDVNGDGFGDVIVGVPFLTKGASAYTGGANVYLGSSTGLATTPHWNPSGGQAGERFGYSVAGAGDVNGDGFNDVIVGARLHDNGQADEGRALVYLGSGAGLSSPADWTAEADQGSAMLGTAVASAGDVNGDGFSDVIVGAPYYDTPLSDAGKVFVWYGDTAGLGPDGTPLNADWSAESELVDAEFGHAVASAGDVNGDGFSDVIIGAPAYNHFTLDDGGAFVWLGSASGLGAAGEPHNANWSAPQSQMYGELGTAVASAGDVNGDGFSDVIVGGPKYQKGDTDEGQAFIYLGNDGGGLDHAPLQTRVNRPGPVHLLGRSDDDYSFGLSALCRTPLGRGQVRLEWEVKPLGILFDGTDLVQGTLTDTGAPDSNGSAVPLQELVDGLSPATRYHWRMRVHTDSPYYQWSPWFSLPYNNITETDILTGGFPDLDQDGYQSDVDCDDGDDQVWSVPGEARALLFLKDKETLTWSPPVEPGGTAVWYDTIRSDDPTAFDPDGTCIESNDGADAYALDPQSPGFDAVFYYLVRAENPCGEGSLGMAGGNMERTAVACP